MFDQLSPFLLFDLPIELVDRVIDYVDEKRDVLALALTCRYFNTLLIPDHLRYRKILMDLCRLEAVENVIARPALGRSIRILLIRPRVSGRRREPLDRFCCGSVEASVVAESRVALALSMMPNLTKFEWDMYHEPETRDLLWEILIASCPRLCDLKVHILPGFIHHSENTLYRSKLFDLRHLTTIHLDITTPHWGDSAIPVHHIRRFLLGSPGLTSLHIAFNSLVPFDTIFSDASWCHLERLFLRTVSCHPTIFDSFLTRHPTIHHIHLSSINESNESWTQGPQYLSLQSGALPNLLHLRIDRRERACRIDDFLQHACWLKIQSISFHRLSCVSDTFTTFLHRHPSLEELSYAECHAIDNPHGILKDLLPGALPKLRKFTGDDFDYIQVCMAGCPLQEMCLNPEELESDRTEEAFRRVAHTLRYIDFTSEVGEEIGKRLERNVPELKPLRLFEPSWPY
ncbi:hypothetical protein JAAARDRAFT_210828 [Jaapia argillacea MUCL 33604]|uniref:F-box domain-containing protein n=1 Tax=Jaapia argillacea MUCL 33604 TaxID=933084 RepID=A0A067PAP8_9AGAM|nr:hypothetical protein JAAARDRAFT_210828 [Jaapia argillacea MUCL 33604]